MDGELQVEARLDHGREHACEHDHVAQTLLAVQQERATAQRLAHPAREGVRVDAERIETVGVEASFVLRPAAREVAAGQGQHGVLPLHGGVPRRMRLGPLEPVGGVFEAAQVHGELGEADLETFDVAAGLSVALHERPTLGRAPAAAEQVRQVVQRTDVVRLCTQRLFVAGDGAGEVARRLQLDAEVELRLGVAGCDAHGPFEQRQRIGALASAEGPELQRQRMVVGGVADLAQPAKAFVAPARGPGAQRRADRLVRGHRAASASSRRLVSAITPSQSPALVWRISAMSPYQ